MLIWHHNQSLADIYSATMNMYKTTVIIQAYIHSVSYLSKINLNLINRVWDRWHLRVPPVALCITHADLM